jgi:hypothetical protein
MKRRSLLLVVCAVISFNAFARGKAVTQTAPGKYKAWGPDIDEVEIVQTFKAADYDKIVVLPFDTAGTPLPDAKEKSYNTIKSALETYTPTLVEALRPELKAKAEVATADKAPKTAKTLIVRGKVEELNPGSRAGRMLVGYGAGGSGTKLSGEIVDAKTGEVLLRFTQARRSGGTFKFAGGNDLDVMRDSIHAAGKDIARIIDSF